MRTIIKNGTVVTACDTTRADVFIEDGKIAQLAPQAHVHGDFEVIDATGKLVLPGGIDAHTHLDMPFGGTTSADDFESGTIAAAYGGTTSIVDFAVQARGKTLRQGLETWLGKAEGKAVIDYGLHMIMTETTPGLLQEMGDLVHEGVSSFKLFMAYPGVYMLDDQSIFKAMLRARDIGALICMHAENGGAIDELIKRALAEGNTAPKWHGLTRPARFEAEATARAIALAEVAGVPVYIVHLSAAEALAAVAEARDRGVSALAETCPQYLFCSFEEHLSLPGFEGAKYVCSPPLREKWHQERLWRGLARNDLQVVSTDHCPFCMAGQKELGRNDFSQIPNGMPGIETRLYLLWEGVREGRISLNRFVDITATAPAKIFGLYPRKGTIAVGSDADLVVWDPDREQVLSQKTLHMKVDYTPYEGRRVRGGPAAVLSRGEIVIRDGKLVGKPGRGRFLRRGTFSVQ